MMIIINNNNDIKLDINLIITIHDRVYSFSKYYYSMSKRLNSNNSKTNASIIKNIYSMLIRKVK